MGAMAGEAQALHGYWWSQDGLRLHYLDYPGDRKRPPILCIPGLTRNARDFAAVAARLSPAWRVICVELRGRGESAYAKDPMSYVPLTYVQDIERLFEETGIKKAVFFGTSLGGLVTMLTAAANPKRIAGALINDIGPEIEAAGLERIKSYAGKAQSWPTWVHAARAIAELNAGVYPGWELTDWIAMAKRLCRLNKSGRIVPDYDLKIAEPMRAPSDAIDLWPAWAALGDKPVALVRGALSDILSAKTARKMASVLPNAKLTTVSGVGHAPTLEEPASMRAIDTLLKSVLP